MTAGILSRLLAFWGSNLEMMAETNEKKRILRSRASVLGEKSGRGTSDELKEELEENFRAKYCSLFAVDFNRK